jgi:hypothetical protein
VSSAEPLRALRVFSEAFGGASCFGGNTGAHRTSGSGVGGAPCRGWQHPRRMVLEMAEWKAHSCHGWQHPRRTQLGTDLPEGAGHRTADGNIGGTPLGVEGANRFN